MQFHIAHHHALLAAMAGRIADAICIYDAQKLSGANGSTVSRWPNTGTGGALFDLTAVVGHNGPATLVRGAGPNGKPYVHCPVGTYFITTQQPGYSTARGPLSGSQPRHMLVVGRLSGTANQQLLCMGAPAGNQGCGMYQYNGNIDRWDYGEDQLIRAAAANTWQANFWRGSFNADKQAYLNYVRDYATNLQSHIPATEAAAPLYINAGFFFDHPNEADYCLIKIGGVLPSLPSVAAQAKELQSIFNLPLK